MAISKENSSENSQLSSRTEEISPEATSLLLPQEAGSTPSLIIPYPFATVSPYPEPVTVSQTPTAETVVSMGLEVCDWRVVGVKETLARENPGITSKIIASISKGTVVSVLCGTEEVLFGMSWNKVGTASLDNELIQGWIPGQDIGYPKVCSEVAINLENFVVYAEAQLSAEPVLLLRKGQAIGLICDSEKAVDGVVWARIRTTLPDETIVLGWALSAEITREENSVITDTIPNTRLRFSLNNYSDDPACISVKINGLQPQGWSIRVDGIPGLGKAYFEGQDARICGLRRQQEVTISIFDITETPIRGGAGIPARGGSIFVGDWR